MPNIDPRHLVAVDVGNSRIKLGRFDGLSASQPFPEPSQACDLPIDYRTGEFDDGSLFAWCDSQLTEPSHWVVASVHRAATRQLTSAVKNWSKRGHELCSLRQLTYRDVPLPILLDEPARIGIDRLLGAFAADRLRRPDHAAIVVDLGSAITVDLLDAAGAFAGGAILPGIGMSARALAEQTDALPAIEMDRLGPAPVALGKSTIAAMQAGLYWGSVGAIREVTARLTTDLAEPPDVFLTGGASPLVAKHLGGQNAWSVRHVPNLVLAGIALAHLAAVVRVDR